jgi:hypothetical protein
MFDLIKSVKIYADKNNIFKYKNDTKNKIRVL